MTGLKPFQTTRIDLDRSELFFAIGGYWTTANMLTFLHELGEQAKPLLRRGDPFDALGDLSEFVPQDRETAKAIRTSLMAAKSNGLRRFAVVSDAMLVKMQYRRIAQGVEVEFFDTVRSAREWLRGGEIERIPNPIAS